jgi:GNAT superfamily N-acetyltransferase
MIQVRTAVVDDADDLAQAHVQGWRVGYRGLFPDEFLDDPEFERGRVERWRAWTWRYMNSSEMYVVVDDVRVIGFSHVGPEREQPACDQSGTDISVSRDGNSASGRTTGEVYGFYLHPDAWGSGAAATLMQRSVEHLREMGYTTAVLWVLRDNPRARAFYEKVGWHVTGQLQMWEGPETGSRPPEPVAEVQYETCLDAPTTPARA